MLLAGLWWVQVVSARDYQANLETQSFRTVRIPAVRGKILDRNGTALAENRPTYNVSLYLEELRRPFEAAYSNDVAAARSELKRQMAASRNKAAPHADQARSASSSSSRRRNGTGSGRQARYEVASNVVMQVSQRLRQPLWLNPTNFERHYQTRLALPSRCSRT